VQNGCMGKGRKVGSPCIIISRISSARFSVHHVRTSLPDQATALRPLRLVPADDKHFLGDSMHTTARLGLLMPQGRTLTR
jgi:hypothetical protein